MFATRSSGYNPDFDLDLEFGEETEQALVDMFNAVDGGHQTMEVKADHQGILTGNVYVELLQYPRTGGSKKSGLNVSVLNADWFTFVVGEVIITCRTRALYSAVKQLWETGKRKLVDGGRAGDNPTKGVLVGLHELVSLINRAPFE